MLSHLALIMDGNRRWATKRSMIPSLGHKQGAKVAQMAIEYCLEHHIKYLSLYTFSLENFSRTQQELCYLFSLIKEGKKQVKQFIEKGIKIRFVGDLSKAPDDTREVCQEIEQATKDGQQLQCNFLFCYGAQQEIVNAVKSLTSVSGTITSDVFKQYLWCGNIPDPDAIIRTGGVKRLSNFLLFQAAYSEIRFLDCFWPDLTKELLHSTVLDCIDVQKNVGK